MLFRSCRKTAFLPRQLSDVDNRTNRRKRMAKRNNNVKKALGSENPQQFCHSPLRNLRCLGADRRLLRSAPDENPFHCASMGNGCTVGAVFEVKKEIPVPIPQKILSAAGCPCKPLLLVWVLKLEAYWRNIVGLHRLSGDLPTSTCGRLQPQGGS